METDLKNQQSESSKRWEFNFGEVKPAEATANQAMVWEPISTNVKPQTRPVLQISRPLVIKPKMSLGSMIGSKGNDNPFLSDHIVANRDSLAFSENNTDSTAAESMFSMCSSSVGKNGSIVDFGRRTSFVSGLMRRRSEQVK